MSLKILGIKSKCSMWHCSKEFACQCWRQKRHGFNPRIGKILWSRKCNPLQYSCLENSVDRGAWWAMVPKGQTRLSAQARGSVLEMFPRRMHVSFSYFRYVLSLQVSSHCCISQRCIDELFYFRCLVYCPNKEV